MIDTNKYENITPERWTVDEAMATTDLMGDEEE